MNQPIIKDPKTVKEADYVVIESTYGNRTHGEDIPDYVGEFTRILRETFAKGRKCCNSVFCCWENTGDPVFYP